jgi:ubiquinone/menaquinone biosynthesis C-methylase UbiE
MNPKDYILIDKVYGNYLSFQEKIQPLISDNSKHSYKILEIGCGTGITTKIITSCNIHNEYIAIDNSKEFIDFAKNNFTKNKEINFVIADALDYLNQEETESFDLVISAFTIHNFNSNYRDQLYKEIFRVLKPKSKFLNIDKFVSDIYSEQINGLKYRIGRYIDVLMEEEKPKLLKEWIEHYIDDQHPDKILKFNETIRRIEKIGFKDVKFSEKFELEMLGIIIAEK